MKNKSKVLFVMLFILQIAYFQAHAQQQYNLFHKKFDLKAGISEKHNSIVIDDNNKIISATLFGLEVFDGIKWKRQNIYNKGKKLYMVYKLQKNLYKKNSYIIASKGDFGFLAYKGDKFHYKSLASKQSVDSIIGKYVMHTIQLKSHTYFFGKNGFTVYNHRDNTLKNIKNNIDISGWYKIFIINQQIVLKDSNQQILLLKNNKWQYSTKYKHLKKYAISKIFSINAKKKVLISETGDFYFSNKDRMVKNTLLSKIFKGSYAFEARFKNQKLFIKSINRVLIFNLQQEQILFTNHFPKARLTNFDIDKNDNLWVSSFDGVFFIEANLVFKARKNDTNTLKQYYIDQYIFDIKRSYVDVEVKEKNKTKIFKDLGVINNIVKVESNIYLCTTKGAFLFNNYSLKKIYNEACHTILNYHKQYNLLFAENKILWLDDMHQITKETSITGLALNAIIFNNKIYYSTEDEAYKIKLDTEGKDIIQISRLVFPNKTVYDFEFFKTPLNLIINNARGIYKINKQNENNIVHLTKNLDGVSKNNNGYYNLNFTYVYYLDHNKFFVVPIYIGEYNGENIPGYVIKNKAGNKFQWYNQPFKRLSKHLLSGINKTPHNTYELTTNDHIIEYDPYKKVNVDYAFKSYIREAKIKVKRADTLTQKATLNDSTIFFGNTKQSTPPTLNYIHNTLTFTYASDSWAAYERNEYSYQLVGLEDTWSNWSKEQKKEYTHLREGTYTFKVRCKNVYGTISSVDSYTFTILPPWYRTTWAYLVYVLAGIGLLVGTTYGYGRYRSRQLYKRNQHLEQVVDERTQEILAQKEEITQQADMLKTANNELKTANDHLNTANNKLSIANEDLNTANEQIKKERDEKVKIYLEEATNAVNSLQQVRDTLISKGADTAKKMLNAEINTAGEMSLIREKVRSEYPAFVEQLDQALMSKQISKLVWQVGHCLKLNMTPVAIATILPTTNRSVSVHGSKLRKLGLLEPVRKNSPGQANS